VVLAGLFAGPEPHRRSVLKGEGSSQESVSAHTGGFGASDGRGALFRHAPGRRGMVRTLRLRLRRSRASRTPLSDLLLKNSTLLLHNVIY
jgi:hypothetical protein